MLHKSMEYRLIILKMRVCCVNVKIGYKYLDFVSLMQNLSRVFENKIEYVARFIKDIFHYMAN